MWLRLLLINATLLFLFAFTANAEGTIKYLHISSSTVYRFSTVKISSRIENEGTTRDKLVFQVALPNDAFVTGFSMVMKNIHIEGRIIKQIQKMLTSNNKKEYTPDNGRPRSTSLFKIIIHAPPKVSATFSLTYQNMLQRRHGLYENVVYITPGQVVEDLKVESKIFETRNITNLSVPPIREDLISDEANKLDIESSEMTLDGRNAKIVFKPTVDQQKAFSKKGINGLYTIKYDVLRGKDKGDIVLWNGYFFHYFAPSGLARMPKDIVFVLDDSTSMTGNKMRNMKEAMYMILDSLHEDDRFHFVQFSNLITPREEGFVKATPRNIHIAKEYVRRTFVARGATNINDAIIEGLKSFDHIEYKPGVRASSLVFLTDGRATVGENDPKRMLSNIKSYNRHKVHIYSISFGADADYPLMQMISYNNHGVPTRIYEGSDSAYQLKLFFEEVAYMLMKGVKFSYNSPYIMSDKIAWSKFMNYYEGSEIITSGRVSDANMKKLAVDIKDLSGGSLRNVEYLADAIYTTELPAFITSEEYSMAMERMWAYLMIKYWMRLKVTGASEYEIEEFERKIQGLSLKYSFLTKGASMMLEGAQGDALTKDISPPVFERDLYGEARARRGKNMRVFADPHFMVTVPELDIPVCFEVIAERGDRLLLLEDPISGVRVTATVIESPIRNKDGRHRTYLGEVFISTYDLQVRITPHAIHLNGLPLTWKQEKSLGSSRLRVVFTGSGFHVTVIVNNSTQMLLQRYLYAYKNPMQVNYLNFYVTDHSGLSPRTTGLLGYFAHAHVNKTTPLSINGELPKSLGLATSNQKTGKIFPFTAHLANRLDVFDIEHTVRCWKVLPHENYALFGGVETGRFFLNDL